jgi:hypothetical protein
MGAAEVPQFNVIENMEREDAREPVHFSPAPLTPPPQSRLARLGEVAVLAAAQVAAAVGQVHPAAHSLPHQWVIARLLKTRLLARYPAGDPVLRMTGASAGTLPAPACIAGKLAGGRPDRVIQG